ncbi:MAG: DUF4364 family protein [Eubacteriales bacterium]|nr:DUF4364 family protein [Eubacteriales bacterium]
MSDTENKNNGGGRQIAENKLILLYIFHKLEMPAGLDQVRDIVLDNYFMNYFLFRQYLSELVDENLLLTVEDGGKTLYYISDSGRQTLEVLSNMIPHVIRTSIDDFSITARKAVKDSTNITAEYTAGNIDEYIATCTAREGDFKIINIKASVSTQKEAEQICENWKKYSHQIYPEIMHSLFNKRDDEQTTDPAK